MHDVVKLDTADLQTETFTNSQGWTVVRVTHLPTALVVERARDRERQSPVQAQTECIAEIKERLGRGERGVVELDGSAEVDVAAARGAAVSPAVTRHEFDALVRRVEQLEQALAKRRS